MCRLLMLQSSAMTTKVAAISLVLIFCFAECAAGSCLSYGHSCWGAHGKRSGASPNADLGLRERADSLGDTRWVLSRLIQAPVDMRPWKSRNEAAPLKHQSIDSQIFNANEGKPIYRQEEQDADVSEVLPANEDVFYLDDPSARSRTTEDKMRLFKLLKNNAGRLN